MNERDLRQKLKEDAGVEQIDELLPVVSRLAVWTAPLPDAAQRRQLTADLRPLLPHPRRPPWPWMAALLRAQLVVVRRELWAASAFVLALGVLVTLALNQGGMPFVLIAPLVTAVGVSFLFGPGDETVLEIELAAPVSQRTLLLARMTLLFAINLIFGVAASLLLALLRQDILFWPLVATWLAPMAFLSALAFFFSVALRCPLLGILVSLALWGAQTARQIAPWTAGRLPDLLAADAQLWLWAAAVLLLLLALWRAGREELWIAA